MLLTEETSRNLLQKLPYGICIYRGSPDTRNLALQVLELLKEHILQGEDLRFRSVHELYSAFDESRCLYVLDIKSEVIGFVFFNVYASANKKPYIYNSSLIVVPSFRRLGLGKMLKSLILQITEKEFSEFDLVSRSSHPLIIQWNEELGYKKITYRQLWEIYGFDAIRDCENSPNASIKFKTSKISKNPFDIVKIVHAPTGRLQRNMALVRKNV